MSRKTSEIVGALRTRQVIGRARELAVIKDAVRTEGELRILYIIGEGGIGKTRLLEEIPRIVAENQMPGSSYRYIGPFDLYLSSIQDTRGLEKAILEALDPEKEGFQNYRKTRQSFEESRTAGGDPGEIEKLRQALEKCFVDEFNGVSSQSRVVLALDTLEVVQYENDAVQEICGIQEPTGLEVKDWLSSNIPRLKNTVVVLAGREKQELIADFRQCFDDQLKILYVGPFDESETLDYFAAIAEVEPAFREIGISPDQQRVIHYYTAGHPLKLSLAIELLTRDLPLPEELFDSLESAQERSADELTAAREQIEENLVTGIMTSNGQIDRVLPYIALARRGVDPELLERLTGWPRQTCAQVLSDLEHFSFVKVRPGGSRLFLHDEMYDLMERHVWNRMEVERESFCNVILGYYKKRIEQAQALPQKQDLIAEQLYYQFLADPEHGYAQYARLSDEALFRHNISFDMRLRDEMLRFCTRYPHRVERRGLTREFMDYDAAVRWVKRYRYTGEYDKGIKIAEAAKAHLPFYQRDVSGFGLARADLDVYHALAFIYTGRDQQGVNLLKKVIADLEEGSGPEVLACQDISDSFDFRRRNLVLGCAHNNLGYVYWMELGYYKAALNEFLSALHYFLASDLEEEIANTYDNMGRVYALLGEKSRAELLIEDGLELRRRLGREFRIGLSLNSQAIVHLAFGQPHCARRISEHALRIFERLRIQRGIGLAHITLGRSLRHLGSLWRVGVHSHQECDEFLRDAVDCLEQAIAIFPEVVDEPIRVIETYNELGCTHRERAALLRSGDPESPLVREEEAKAEENLRTATEKAEGKNPVLYVDSCEDLAQTYFQWEDLDGTEVWLNRAAEAIPRVYKIEKDLGLQDILVEECVEEFWRQMGKIEILRGHVVFARGSGDGAKISRQILEQAMQHYVFAAAYFERYSERVVGLHAAFERLYDNFRCCQRDDLKYAQDQLLPFLATTYSLDISRLSKFFKDTLGLALSVAK